LPKATAVVVDLTDATENVTWELQLASKTLPSARIAVISQSPNHQLIPPDVVNIQWDGSRASNKAARKLLEQWTTLNVEPARSQGLLPSRLVA